MLHADEGSDSSRQMSESPAEPGWENPFDQHSTQLILTLEQQVRQRLLGRQATQSAAGAQHPSQAHTASAAQLQQAEHRIQQLQR